MKHGPDWFLKLALGDDWDEFVAWRDRKKPKPKPQKPKPPKHRPPKEPPPAPKPPPPSWKLQNGPWIFVMSDPGTVPAGPWTRLDLIENHIAPGAPLWYCSQGKSPQAEGGNQSAACVDWIKANPGGSIAPVTTLGIPVEPYAALGVTSAMVECYLQGQVNALDKYGQAFREGWADVIPVIGVGWTDQNGTYSFTDYAAWLKQIGVGSRFGVYASDSMQEQDWNALRAYLA